MLAASVVAVSAAGGCQRAPAGMRDDGVGASSTHAGGGRAEQRAASDGANGAAVPPRPAIAGEADTGECSDIPSIGCSPRAREPAWRAWQTGMHERMLAARPLIGSCGQTRRGRLAALAPAIDTACTCGVLCAVRFDPLPTGASELELRLPFAEVEGFRFVVRADGAVTRCDFEGTTGRAATAHVSCNEPARDE